MGVGTRAERDPAAVGIDDLERSMALHWQPPDRDLLGEWLLRGAGGFTGRGNSVLAVGEPGMPLPEAVAAVTRWYAGRGLPGLAALPEPVPGSGPPGGHDPSAAARRAFTTAGWRVRAGAGALVLTARTATLTAGPPGLDAPGFNAPGLDTPALDTPGLDALVPDLADEPDEGWLSCYRYRGQELPPQATLLLRSAPDQVFASVRRGGTTVAVARGSLGDAWLGLTAVEVGPGYRRRGLARALLALLARWGLERGAEGTCLQVGDANAAAITLYRRAGFEVHHRYDYYIAPPGDS